MEEKFPHYLASGFRGCEDSVRSHPEPNFMTLSYSSSYKGYYMKSHYQSTVIHQNHIGYARFLHKLKYGYLKTCANKIVFFGENGTKSPPTDSTLSLSLIIFNIFTLIQGLLFDLTSL